MKALLGKFLFTNAVIACALLLFCGAATVSQRTAYNIYLKEYAVLSMVNEGRAVKMQGLPGELTFFLPEKNQLADVGKYLKFTPFATTVFFLEKAEDIWREIF